MIRRELIRYKKPMTDFLVDEEDIGKVSKLNWVLDSDGYVVSQKKKLHRYVLDLNDSSILVDHINGNKLDNRKTNLRCVNSSTNGRNRHSKPRNALSRYIGVTYDNRRTPLKKRWVAHIKLNYKGKFLGRYETEEEAALAYNREAEKLGFLTRNAV